MTTSNYKLLTKNDIQVNLINTIFTKLFSMAIRYNIHCCSQPTSNGVV